jgi:Domain of unknown function (DUF4148)
MSNRTLISLAALAVSALTLGSASAATSWHQPDFADVKPTVEKTRAQVRAETIQYLAAGGKHYASGEAAPKVEPLPMRTRAEVVAELLATPRSSTQQNAERS